MSKRVTFDQFDDAVIKLIGHDEYSRLKELGYERPDVCRYISQNLFITGKAHGTKGAFSLMKKMAKRIWKKDGTLDLVK